MDALAIIQPVGVVIGVVVAVAVVYFLVTIIKGRLAERKEAKGRSRR